MLDRVPAGIGAVVADLPPEVLQYGGVLSLLVGIFWMLATGRLVTRREADGYREDRDTWRETAMVTGKQLDRLLENDVLALSILKSIDARATHASEVGP